MRNDFSILLPEILNIAKKAGQAIMSYFGDTNRLEIRHKTDNTPITKADIISHEIVLTGLSKLTPEIPVLSEEGDIPDYSVRKTWDQYWCCDPLDGTQGFLRGCEEFTVNIALIENHKPVLAALYSPVFESMYYAYQGGGAYKQSVDQKPIRINTSPLSDSNIRLIIGRYHSIKRFEKLSSFFPDLNIIQLNSSLKFAYLAEGKADMYLRYGPTGEWDTAAGQCILEEAGGMVVDLQGQSLHYNGQVSIINPPFLAIGAGSKANSVLAKIDKISRYVR